MRGLYYSDTCLYSMCEVQYCIRLEYMYTDNILLESYSTIVLYSRDHKGVGMAHEITSSKNQPYFSLTMRQHCLGKIKPNRAFRLTWNAFNKLLRNFKNNLFNGIFY